MASDSTPSLLFRNNRHSGFTEEGAECGLAFSIDGAEQAGMGVAVGDYNLDSNLDICKTHFSDDTKVLYRNDGDGNFTDVPIPAVFAVGLAISAGGQASPISTTTASRISLSSPAPYIPKWRRNSLNIR